MYRSIKQQPQKNYQQQTRQKLTGGCVLYQLRATPASLALQSNNKL